MGVLTYLLTGACVTALGVACALPAFRQNARDNPGPVTLGLVICVVAWPALVLWMAANVATQLLAKSGKDAGKANAARHKAANESTRKDGEGIH